ncbi:MAG: replicative DNA helicase [Oscillospiraceae bacterium]|nr:replicative DNA helicase [Oscillospiraceae bacterium]
MERTSLPIEALGVTLPFSIEAEQAVLGAVIVDSAAFYEVTGIVGPEHFYHRQNGAIFREMQLLFAAGIPIDYVTVLDAAVNAGIFESEDEAKVYLYGVAETVPSVSNAASYARIVYDKYLLRSLINASREIMQSSSEAQENASALLDFAEQRIYEIRTGRDASELYRIDAVIMETLDRLYRLTGPDRDKYLGIPTGFRHLDRVLTGLNKGDLIVLAARPGVGKTSLALNIAANVAKYHDCAVAFFSLEMTTSQLAARLLSSESKVVSQSFRTGELNPDDWKKIAETTEVFAKSKLYMDDTSGISVAEIKAKSRRLDNLGLIIVDYLQLMGGSGRRESRVQEISDITRAFKIMGKELGVPIILLSQLSRENEKAGRPPMLSDLRDSGSIEQDSDIVLFLHRKNPQNDSEDEGEEENEVLLMVSKNRHGERTNIRLHWDGRYTRFTSMDYSHDV